MKKSLLILLFSFLLMSAFSQRSEIGFGGGTSFYLGDINPKGVFYEAQWSAGVHYRYNFTTRWAMRWNFNYGRIHGEDAKHDNARNLDFRNDIFEFSGVAELNFLTFFTGSKKSYKFSPYLFAGLGGFYHEPQGSYYVGEKLKWTNLRGLHTEGQGWFEEENKVREEYKAVQFCLPFGLGFKYSLSKNLSLELEWGMRFTSTDYLDDVSTTYVVTALIEGHTNENEDRVVYMSDKSDPKNTVGAERGNSSTLDWYSFAMLKLSYKIYTNPRHNCPAYGNH